MKRLQNVYRIVCYTKRIVYLHSHKSPNISKPRQILAGQPKGTESTTSSLYIRTGLLLGLPCSFLCSNFCCRALFTIRLAIDVVTDRDGNKA